MIETNLAKNQTKWAKEQSALKTKQFSNHPLCLRLILTAKLIKKNEQILAKMTETVNKLLST